MVNIRKSFDRLLSQWGHDVFLQRRISFDEGSHKPIFKNELERHTVRHRYPANRGLPGITEYLPQGKLQTVDMIYYFRADASPREGDRIYEDDGRFEGDQTIWLIDYALPLRGRRGIIDYWTVGVTREWPS